MFTVAGQCAQYYLYFVPLNPLNNFSIISILKWGNKLKMVQYSTLGGTEGKGDDNYVYFIGLLQNLNEVIFLTQLKQCLAHNT